MVRSTSAEFLIGSGSGIANSVSAIAVGTLGRLYHLLGQNEANQHYTNGSIESEVPLHTGDFSVLTRFEDVGADPWHVLLVLATVVIGGVGVASEPTARVAGPAPFWQSPPASVAWLSLGRRGGAFMTPVTTSRFWCYGPLSLLPR